ncbi:MAG: hypothetical protein RJA81_1763 [Planctomycetota bacterium]
MPATYFPIDYFSYAVYGLSGDNSTQPFPNTDNTIMNLLENIANGLSDLLSADRVLLYANSEFPDDPPGREAVVVELFPKSVYTIPIITSPSANVTTQLYLEFSVRVTLRSWRSQGVETVMQAMTEMTRYLTGNRFGASEAGASRIEKMRVIETEPGTHQILVHAQASALS